MIIVLLYMLSLIACVYSRSLTTHGGHYRTGHRKHKNSAEMVWDSSMRKREEVFKTIPDECCPSVTEIFQPLGGKAKNGQILELYRDQNSTQSFYQTSCLEGVKGRACKYVKQNRRVRSMCVQRYTYTYALVRELNSDAPWRMDYIKLRSGCTCEIQARVFQEYLFDKTTSEEDKDT